MNLTPSLENASETNQGIFYTTVDFISKDSLYKFELFENSWE